jgi:hypothetical protein
MTNRGLVGIIIATVVVAVLVVGVGRYATAGCLSCADTPAINPATQGFEASRSPGPAVFADELAGSWSGTLVQSNKRSWKMTVRIDKGSGVATVTYPELNCTGQWQLKSIERTVLHLREHITDVTPRCSSDGTVDMTPQTDQTLSIAYVPDEGNYTATATLRRA